jgi:hypothetical protein
MGIAYMDESVDRIVEEGLLDWILDYLTLHTRLDYWAPSGIYLFYPSTQV